MGIMGSAGAMVEWVQQVQWVQCVSTLKNKPGVRFNKFPAF